MRRFSIGLLASALAIIAGCWNPPSDDNSSRNNAEGSSPSGYNMLLSDERLAQEQIHAGHAAYREAHLKEAIELFDNGASHDPSRWDAFYLSGKLRLEIGDVTGAIEKLLVAHRVAPHDYDILIELGNAYYDDGDFKNAETVWQRAVVAAPNRGFAYNNLGIMRAELNNYVDAVAMFSSGIEHSSYPPLFKGRALSNMELGNYDEAIDDLEQLMVCMPDTAVFHWYRGRCRFALGQVELALADAERACSIDPGDSEYVAFLQACRNKRDGG